MGEADRWDAAISRGEGHGGQWNNLSHSRGGSGAMWTTIPVADDVRGPRVPSPRGRRRARERPQPHDAVVAGLTWAGKPTYDDTDELRGMARTAQDVMSLHQRGKAERTVAE